ncbi:MAG TPA: hypothetical protein DCM86_19910 [Verrucomicrobiales bacterium]|nr:hypothetical protein [Verrucomicrobiales bacterium]
MATQLTAEDARSSLTEHAASKGVEIHEAYGPNLGWNELLSLLKDRRFVRYPCAVKFDEADLEPGEFGHASPVGDRPDAGFVISIHPFFLTQLDRVPALVLYQLVLVNYGDFASPDDAEAFGAAALGLPREAYYEQICDLSDQLE